MCIRDSRDGRRLADVRAACAELEASTRLSAACCETFAAHGAVADLCGLLRTCNRSAPHVELLAVALRVLANVAARAHLAARVAAAPGALDVLLDLVAAFRDKREPFLLAARLLRRLVAADAAARDKCRTPEATKRLASVAALLKLRKHDAQANELALLRKALRGGGLLR